MHYKHSFSRSSMLWSKVTSVNWQRKRKVNTMVYKLQVHFACQCLCLFARVCVYVCARHTHTHTHTHIHTHTHRTHFWNVLIKFIWYCRVVKASNAVYTKMHTHLWPTSFKSRREEMCLSLSLSLQCITLKNHQITFLFRNNVPLGNV